MSHLTPERLGVSSSWSADERAHVDRCPLCRQEARIWAAFDRDAPVAPPEPAVDAVRRLSGLPYEILSPLGSPGGMGEVWRAHDPDLGRTVALKRIAPHLLPGPDLVEQFEREARITARLQHPGVVPIYQLARGADGLPFYTMREVAGRMLHTAIREPRSGEASLRRLIDAFARVCETIAFAHAEGVVHRDLKPANVMLGEYGEVLVIDWGIARRLDDDDEAADWLAGTPEYLAPELWAGGRPAWPLRVDVFSLGAILYEILAIHPPDGSPLPAHAPEELAEVARRAMEAEPELRLPDAAAVAARVRSWLEGALRKVRADQLVDEADAIAADVTRLRAEAAALLVQAKKRLEPIAAWEPAELKEAGWALEDEAERLDVESHRVHLAWSELLRSALVEAPDHPGALERLADHYAREQADAEALGDQRRAAAAESRLRLHDRGRFAAWLQGTGSFSVATDPPGAEVTLYRYETRGRRKVEVFEARLGRTPLTRQPIRAGSYRLRVRAPGRAEVTLPIQIGRLEHWDGVRPGDRDPFPVPLPALGDLGPDDVYVPAGWCRLGGDPRAAFGAPARRVWVDGFVIRRFPVTNREMIGFLDALVAAGDSDTALRFAPRERSGIAGKQGELIYRRSSDGRFEVGADTDGTAWENDWPVLQIDLPGALAFARWEAERTAQPWRLPFEAEWEKAGRGVDGRFFPWGDRFDESWACSSHSHPDRNQKRPVAVTAFPADESPYGVRGMAGNVRDRCLDRFADPPPIDGTVVRRVWVDGEGSRVLKGGSWGDTEQLSRLAERTGVDGSVRGGKAGFRLVRPFP